MRIANLAAAGLPFSGALFSFPNWTGTISFNLHRKPPDFLIAQVYLEVHLLVRYCSMGRLRLFF